LQETSRAVYVRFNHDEANDPNAKQVRRVCHDTLDSVSVPGFPSAIRVFALTHSRRNVFNDAPWLILVSLGLMLSIRHLLSVGSLAFSLCCCSVFADQQTAFVRQAAEQSSAALVKGDYGRVCDFSYRKVLEMIGGRDKGIETLRRRAEAMKSDGVTLLGADISEPKEIIATRGKRFAIVPMQVMFKSPKGIVRSKGFLIAISGDHGRTWTFVDGTNMTKENLAQLLPELPSDVPLPSREVQALVPNRALLPPEALVPH
jgi:hypothetical protein